MIVIEGGDYVGKTTFQQMLFKQLRKTQFPHTKEHLSRPAADFNCCNDYIKMMHRNVIYDRFHISMLAYRCHDDHPCSMTQLKWNIVQAKLRLQPTLVVVMAAHPDVIVQRYEENAKTKAKEDMYNLEHSLEVNQTFIDLVQEGGLVCRDEDYGVSVDIMIDNSTDKLDALEDGAKHVLQEYMKLRQEFDELDVL